VLNVMVSALTQISSMVIVRVVSLVSIIHLLIVRSLFNFILLFCFAACQSVLPARFSVLNRSPLCLLSSVFRGTESDGTIGF
jgi:hypothetical protein